MPVRTFEGAYVAGFSELPVQKTSSASTLELIDRAFNKACEDAGLGSHEIDGLAVGSFTLAPDHAVNVARELGLTVDWLAPQEPGGVGGISACLAAARAIDAGDAQAVACIGADVLDTASLSSMMESFSSEVSNWLAPIGAHPANVIFGLLQDRYMHRYGISRRDIGRVAVLQRSQAAGNPNALLTEPMGIDDYLSAPPVAAPVHLYDCVLPGAGASGVIITSEALDRRERRVRLRAGAERHNHAQRPDVEQLGWSMFAEQLFEAVDVDPAGIDAVQLYDDYPAMVLWQLEELGLAKQGTGAELVARVSKENRPFELNTGGGMLSLGQAGAAGGYVAVVEAVRWLTLIDRDVISAKRRLALASGLGMVGYGLPLSVGALIFERA